jgi:DNA-binding NarL/FixJ family response regulator
MTRTILVVEDGVEYIDAFRRLAAGAEPVAWLHARDAAGARDLLERHRVDAIFLDVVFDRTEPGRLVGDGDALAARFGSDRERRNDHLARQQGFYVLAALAATIEAGTRVLLAHDFSGEPTRLEALRRSVPGLEGVAEAATTTEVLRRLLAP